MFNPLATYRIQFHKDFTFHHLEKIIPYLKQIGVSTIYASPIFESIPGSTHGYDALNPNALNLEIGQLKDLKRISKALNDENIGWLQDVVPNHMAFDWRNPWLNDVLEKGKDSPYASYFDIDWNSEHGEKLMAPFLGSTLDQVLKQEELTLIVHQDQLMFQYFDAKYPANFFAYKLVLENLSSIISKEIFPANYADSQSPEYFQQLKTSFAQFVGDNSTSQSVSQAIKEINANQEKLANLLHQQHYLLCHWQTTDTEINYRRFFTVNGLICLNIQHEKVFQEFHSLIKKLIDEKLIHGLRIDHIDGLFDPAQYLERLKNITGNKIYITVEKILQSDEKIPSNWKAEGNTGYDFLAIVNNLFTNSKSEKLAAFYDQLVPTDKTFLEQLREKKAQILYQHMGGELKNLHRLFLSTNLVEKKELEAVGEENLEKAIGEFLVFCPVYRYYGNIFPLEAAEAKAVEEMLSDIKETKPALSSAINLLSSVFLKPYENEEKKQRALYFYQRCMQFSGPLMAKGFEDTLMYTFNRFIAHNEVGDSPASSGYSIEAFHLKMKERQNLWPLSINATATHDTKRGEDVRARLNVLSDITDQWIEKVTEWMQLNKEYKTGGMPDTNDEYFIYQTLVGHYPMPGENDDDFKNRLNDYLQKALREGKKNSNWSAPNEEYENATKTFASGLLNKEQSLWKSFQAFQKNIVDYGITNSLIQVILKFTCPGIPDVYHGTEMWDLSFVDPDNRRAVDYLKQDRILNEIKARENKKDFFDALWEDRYTGKIKLWLTRQLFLLRKEQREIFTEGDYIPLAVEGEHKKYILAFARKDRQTVFIVVVALHLAELCMAQKKEWRDLDWADTNIVLPNDFLTPLENVLGSEKISFKKHINAKELFHQMPFAILKGSVAPNERGAGILLHISSLPSAFGIGDLGPEARIFANFLYRSHQKYWQLLPLNPTERGQGHSPYSSTSSMAGNVLFISPELLEQNGFLDRDLLNQNQLPASDKVDFTAVDEIKHRLLNEAWERFKNTAAPSWQNEFDLFCQKEKDWLDDFCLFMILKEQYKGQPWYQWPDEFKFRSEKALKNLPEKFPDQYQKQKWFQFIFSKQWNQLKKYCNDRHIEFIGDMPFYVSYDSADVWSNTEIFKLDSKGNKTGVAGVPPDAFSDDGQLWGMPVFRWNVLKKNNYKWWIDRLRKNVELFDVTRLDHFRAFSDYWEVAATEKTAKKGKWQKGPGTHFFKYVKQALGALPFIAEDLGEIDEPVYQLRDEFRLPGMKVLQFAFGEDMGSSLHIPHNYKQNFFVYTGTHDNNTSLGWWKTDATQPRVEEYFGEAITESKIAPLLCRMAYSSIAKVAILPMQDVLSLDESARMNMPSSTDNNWQWRLLPCKLTDTIESQLKLWTKIYHRR